MNGGGNEPELMVACKRPPSAAALLGSAVREAERAIGLMQAMAGLAATRPEVAIERAEAVVSSLLRAIGAADSARMALARDAGLEATPEPPAHESPPAEADGAPTPGPEPAAAPPPKAPKSKKAKR